jgi:amino acid permease
MNILGKNSHTGEIITYRPVVIVYSIPYLKSFRILLIIFLSILVCILLYIAFYVYRKYKIKRLQLNFIEENDSENSISKKLKKEKTDINLDFVKTDDDDHLDEENRRIN